MYCVRFARVLIRSKAPRRDAMGTQASIPVRSIRVIRSDTRQSRRPHAEPLPKSFDEALQTGWLVVAERTVLGADKRHRHGTLTLVKKGALRPLAVAYTASIRTGFVFEKPQLAN
jgi:hypothetical protein